MKNKGIFFLSFVSCAECRRCGPLRRRPGQSLSSGSRSPALDFALYPIAVRPVARPDPPGLDVLLVSPAAKLLAAQALERGRSGVCARLSVVLARWSGAVGSSGPSGKHHPGLQGVPEDVAELVGHNFVLLGQHPPGFFQVGRSFLLELGCFNDLFGGILDFLDVHDSVLQRSTTALD